LKQEVDSIVSAVAQFNERPIFDRPSLVENAYRFSKTVFKMNFFDIVNKYNKIQKL